MKRVCSTSEMKILCGNLQATKCVIYCTFFARKKILIKCPLFCWRHSWSWLTTLDIAWWHMSAGMSVMAQGRDAQKVMSLIFLLSKYLVLNHENYTLWKAMLLLQTLCFHKSLFTSTALHQWGTSVCMPCEYHALSCSHSQVLIMWFTSPISNFTLQISSFRAPNKQKSEGATLRL